MGFTFDRQYKVTISRAKSVTQPKIIPPLLLRTGASQPEAVVTPERDLISFTKLRIKANLLRDISSSNATSKLVIYNAGSDIIDALNSDDDLLVTIQAGYRIQDGIEVKVDSLPVIYKAEIAYVAHDLSGGDVLSTIELSSMKAIAKYEVSNEKITKGTSLKAAYEQLIKNTAPELYISWTTRAEEIAEIVFPTTWTAEGRFSPVLKSLATRFDLNLTMDNGAVLISNKTPTGQGNKITLAPETVKGYPKVMRNAYQNKSTQEKPPQVHVKTFMRSDIQIGDYLTVDIKEFGSVNDTKTQFRAELIRYTMDSHDGADWTCEIQGKSVSK